MKNCYKTHNHAKFKIRYHVILSVKYRKKLLKSIIESLKKSLKRAEEISNGWKIEAIETDSKNGKDDHIHLLIKSNPQIAPFNIIKTIKQITTFDMWNENKDYLEKFFFNGKHYLWTRGYFCSTVGNVSEETLKEYIARG